MQPEPALVVATLAELLESDWPTAPDDVEPWLAAHGVRPSHVTEGPPDEHTMPSCRRWSASAVPGWGPANLGWHTYREEFVGLVWFLWSDATTEEVLARASALAAGLTATFGAPSDASAHSEQGWTSFWRLPQHTIDLYAHPGRSPRPDIPPAGHCVQLHLDLTERADARERAAQDRAARDRVARDRGARDRADDRTGTAPRDGG